MKQLSQSGLATAAFVVGFLCVATFLGFQVFASGGNSEPKQLIEKAREMVSLSAIGPFELQAEVRVASAHGDQKGTYLLDWAAPDRFRREVHLPGYDEITVVNGVEMDRKRNTDYTPLIMFRLEEMMRTTDMIDQIRRDLARPTPAPKYPGQFVPPPSSELTEPAELSGRQNVCISPAVIVYDDLCVDASHSWPTRISHRSTGDDEMILYADYQQVGSGFVARKRQYLDSGRPIEQVNVKRIVKMKDFPAGAFAPPPDAAKLAWCSDEIPAERLPLKPPLPITEEDFLNPKIVDAFVNADGTVSRMVILATGGPAADVATRKMADLIHFTPATCNGKSEESETPFVISELDIEEAIPLDVVKVPIAGENGYTRPVCFYCPTPPYSDTAFKAKIQGEMILDTIIRPDGRAHYIRIVKRLGYGLDEEAIKAARNVWRFKPATGPDGKPAAVRMLIDVDFRLY